MTKTELLNRCARDDEERVLLARAMDRLALARDRGVPAHTQFLSPAQQASLSDLLAACGHPRHFFFGGFEGAERQICVFLPDWQEQEGWLADPDSCLSALRCTFPKDAKLTHRDILGSLMGLGITRELLGDILQGEEGWHLLAMTDALPILLSQWESAGRWRVSLEPVALDQLTVVPPQVRTVRDTVATLRLDAVLASGFSLSRGKAAELVSAGRVSLNHRECTKCDRAVAQGDVLTCRGLGKCVVSEILGQSRKGRIMIVLERYV